MSRIKYNGRIQAQTQLFSSARLNLGGIYSNFGRNMGGLSSSVIIGPDLSLPGGTTNNPPNVTGQGWDQAWIGAGYPTVTFVGPQGDTSNTWIAGHLVNGEWRGPGNNWANITPLTSQANANHKTVETYMKNFCLASLQYDNSTYRNDWYGILYIVQRSTTPWAAPPAAQNNLYSYAPEFIKVSWRAISITKPNLQANQVQNFLDTIAIYNSVPVMPAGFNVPTRPTAIGGPCVPAAGNVPGGAVYPPIVAIPPAQGNGFDGEIEVHQS